MSAKAEISAAKSKSGDKKQLQTKQHPAHDVVKKYLTQLYENLNYRKYNLLRKQVKETIEKIGPVLEGDISVLSEIQKLEQKDGQANKVQNSQNLSAVFLEPIKGLASKTTETAEVVASKMTQPKSQEALVPKSIPEDMVPNVEQTTNKEATINEIPPGSLPPPAFDKTPEKSQRIKSNSLERTLSQNEATEQETLANSQDKSKQNLETRQSNNSFNESAQSEVLSERFSVRNTVSDENEFQNIPTNMQNLNINTAVRQNSRSQEVAESSELKTLPKPLELQNIQIPAQQEQSLSQSQGQLDSIKNLKTRESGIHQALSGNQIPDQSAKIILYLVLQSLNLQRKNIAEISLKFLITCVSNGYILGVVDEIQKKHSSKMEGQSDQGGEQEEARSSEDGDIVERVNFDECTPQRQCAYLILKTYEFTDDSIQMLLLKALLVLATSHSLVVHGSGLLDLIRIGYQISKLTKNEIIFQTARACLVQIIVCVFQRMEADSQYVQGNPKIVLDALTKSGDVEPQGSVHDSVQKFLIDGLGLQMGVNNQHNQEIMKNNEWDGIYSQIPDSPLHQDGGIFSVQQKGSQNTLNSDQQSQGNKIKAHFPDQSGGAPHPIDSSIKNGDISAPPPAENKDGPNNKALPVTDGTLGNTGPESNKAEIQHDLSTQDIVNQLQIHEKEQGVVEPLQINQDAQNEFEKHLQMQQQQLYKSVWLKDALMVFRSLCKLAVSNVEKLDMLGSIHMILRSNSVVLELIKIIMDNAGRTFEREERFALNAKKQYICISLLKHSMAPVAPNTQFGQNPCTLASSIFISLILQFRTKLKSEVGIFYPLLLLKAIEPSKTSLIGGNSQQVSTPPGLTEQQHRAIILKCLIPLIADGQCVIDLFVNYDCDMEGQNLFERTVGAFVILSQGAPQTADMNVTEKQLDSYIKQQSLANVVTILQSLNQWYLKISGLYDMPDETDEFDNRSQIAHSRASFLHHNHSMATEAYTEISSIKHNGMTPKSLNDMPSFINEYGGELDQKRTRKKKILEGVERFNKKPNKGLQWLQQQKLVGTSPQEVGLFLTQTHGLDKFKVGDFIGERDQYTQQILSAYIESQNFTGLEVDEALRQLLQNVGLRGEAQKIDRFMLKFAEWYHFCNPKVFKLADVAYTMAFSIMLLNTDLYNNQVKNKMDEKGFVKNNRGINDGQDLPEEFLIKIYTRIKNQEIKTKPDDILQPETDSKQENQGYFDFFSQMLGRKVRAGPDLNVNKMQEFLRDRAKETNFYQTQDISSLRPMLDVAWAPIISTFSVLFSQSDNELVLDQCLKGLEQISCLTAQLSMGVNRNTFIRTLIQFTNLDDPSTMKVKNSRAFLVLLRVVNRAGDSLGDIHGATPQEQTYSVWPDIIRAISDFEQLSQLASGKPTDQTILSISPKFYTQIKPRKVNKWFNEQKNVGLKRLNMLDWMNRDSVADEPGQWHLDKDHVGQASPTSIPTTDKTNNDFQNAQKTQMQNTMMMKRQGKAVQGAIPPPEVLNIVSQEDLNKIFEQSYRLGNGEPILQFVDALCQVSIVELKQIDKPRVFCMTKIVEVAHNNLGKRVNYVWKDIWAKLSDYFAKVGCHPNLAVAMATINSLKILSLKFLEKDEYANFNVQNEFLKPFGVVIGNSESEEVREMIISCVSQMVLQRVKNIRSGWKSIFLVFSLAARDQSSQIVRLAFETMAKIVRDYFKHITATDITTFTDCVNCLVAFTQNVHHGELLLDISLNAIAFLRFCAEQLADGAIGNVEDVKLEKSMRRHIREEVVTRIKSQDQNSLNEEVDEAQAEAGGPQTNGSVKNNEQSMESLEQQMQEIDEKLSNRAARFTDREEHIYFWFPLLAGLSELTYDPREPIRNSATAILMDTLKYHGHSFSQSFWIKIYDRVLLPIFDQVRADIPDYPTQGASQEDDKRRAREDRWLYETSKQNLHFLIEIFAQFYDDSLPVLDRILDLMKGLAMRNHEDLAAMGVAGLYELIIKAGDQMSQQVWQKVMATLLQVTQETYPNMQEMLTPPLRTNSIIKKQQDDIPNQKLKDQKSSSPSTWTLREGLGARRLQECKCKASVQLRLAQACGNIYANFYKQLSVTSTSLLLGALNNINHQARGVNQDQSLRLTLMKKQTEDQVPANKQFMDPPFIALECEASEQLLSVLLHIYHRDDQQAREIVQDSNIEQRLINQCLENLQRFAAVCSFKQSNYSRTNNAEPQTQNQTQQTPTSDTNSATPQSFNRNQTQDVQLKNKNASQQGQGYVQMNVAFDLENEREHMTDLIVSSLKTLGAFPDNIFKRELKTFFPILTNLIGFERCPPKLQQALSELFAMKVGPLLAQ